MKGCDESAFAESSSSNTTSSTSNKRSSGGSSGGSGDNDGGYFDSVVDSFHGLGVMAGVNNNDEIDDNYVSTIDADFETMADIIAQQSAPDILLFQTEKGSNPSKSVQKRWKLVGVDPRYSHEGQHTLLFDEASNTAKIALQGSVSGTAEIVDHSGTALATPYPDLSHMVCMRMYVCIYVRMSACLYMYIYT